MITKNEFKDLVQCMVDAYNVDSYLDNIEEDMTQEEIDNDLWFQCPECGEPILWDDWAYNRYLADGVCPICETVIADDMIWED